MKVLGMERCWLGLSLLLSDVLLAAPTAGVQYWDYIVVGAGPSGLQSAYHLEQAGRNYVVLERGNVTGFFFTQYPRHDVLISINKRHTGQINREYNMRHDWNSLVSHDDSLLYKHYSKDFFPHRTTMLRYLSDYHRRLNINVAFNVNVGKVTQAVNSTTGENQFEMRDQNNNQYICKTLIMAVGISKPNIPDFIGKEYVEGYEDVSVNPDEYEGQSVLILGRGNSAFEMGASIYGNTNLIHIMGRSRVRLSWETHYVGDIRAINNALLDTYQLKSLDGVLEAPVEDLVVMKLDDGRLKIGINPGEEDEKEKDTSKEEGEEEGDQDETDISMFDNFALREPYHRIIRCLGFMFDDSIFLNASRLTYYKKKSIQKYPRIYHNYESRDFSGLYFAGGLTHSLDHRKSAGGFIHGFRYTAGALHHLLEWRNHQVPWPSVTLSLNNLLPYIIKRVNEASGLYQMFGVLGDVIAIREGEMFEYFQAFPVKLLPEFTRTTGHQVDAVVVLVLEYGQNFSGPGKDIFREDRATGEPSEGHLSNFLHPVLYYYEELPTVEEVVTLPKWQVMPRPTRLHHVVEDFLAFWNTPLSHILPLRRFFENILDLDLRQFFAEDCMMLMMLSEDVPLSCRTQHLQGQGIVAAHDMVEMAAKLELKI